jgi:hypothetical protein
LRCSLEQSFGRSACSYRLPNPSFRKRPAGQITTNTEEIDDEPALNGKVALITGANSGIG